MLEQKWSCIISRPGEFQNLQELFNLTDDVCLVRYCKVAAFSCSTSTVALNNGPVSFYYTRNCTVVQKTSYMSRKAGDDGL